MAINMTECEVNWEKTKENINSHLDRLVYKNALSEQFYLGDRTLQRKLNPRDKMKLSIGELVLISRFLQCSLEELVILQGDTYTGLPFENGENKPELGTAKDVQEYISMVEKQNSECKIRNLNEFLLYLPLMNEAVVRDVVFRCYGNLEIDESNYLRSQMNYLYQTISDCPEKRYADWYRDNVLRVKGHPREDFLGESYGDAYFLKILEYGGGLDPVKRHS